MPCLASAALSPTPDSNSNCGVWNAPEETMTSRRARICLTASPCRYSTPTARLPSNKMRVALGPRRAPAFAVLLRDLVDAEAFVILGVEILADPELRLTRGLQKCLLHRIVGAQPVDSERSALAVVFAIEIGVVFRALEVGQHVGIGPADIAQRRPLIVIAAVAADIDHGVDGGGAAEPLAARLVADPPLKASLRHGIESPVVEFAGNHQRQRARRGDHPIIARAAGLEHGHRRLGILGKPAGDRAAAGAAAHHHEIDRVRHALPPMFFRYPARPARAFLVPRLGFCGLSGKSAPTGQFGALNAGFGRHKILKSRLLALSKAGPRWYIPLAPNGVRPGCLLRKPPDRFDRRPRALAKFVSASVFDKACNGLSRG